MSHLAAGFLLAENIVHGVNLRKSSTLQYLYPIISVSHLPLLFLTLFPPSFTADLSMNNGDARNIRNFEIDKSEILSGSDRNHLQRCQWGLPLYPLSSSSIFLPPPSLSHVFSFRFRVSRLLTKILPPSYSRRPSVYYINLRWPFDIHQLWGQSFPDFLQERPERFAVHR